MNAKMIKLLKKFMKDKGYSSVKGLEDKIGLQMNHTVFFLFEQWCKEKNISLGEITK